MEPEPGMRWPLTARDRELSDFGKAWAEPRCQGVVVSGPVGVGKTRLAEEFLDRVVNTGWTGLRATCTEVAEKVPLGAIAHLIPTDADLSDPVSGFAAVSRALAGAHE